ncbi:hypothetical protein [Marinobacterium lutimaris]|uniref:Uncharacterized protein n=1 Tax=Marinobacterium lutimaris TaxID=568106 RepID=A0A1H5XRT6_9GAMM|nr:hypothetical protein [Marinobacterium lutimaris]SEG14431.1 hypothetical protein SAMN05444390_1011482 [Marinobacterium lutimaris]
MIGSGVIGVGAVAGELGIISPEADLIQFNQNVKFREIEPSADLIVFEQSVGEIEPARDLIRFQQRVGSVAARRRLPQAYIWINGVDYSSYTALDSVSVSFNEDQSATASIFVFRPLDAVINIPSFHAKQIRIETHVDPNDPASDVFPLFTGWIETAQHDRTRRGIAFTCSNLRDERLGDEDAGQLRALTGGVYSNVTQVEDAKGRDYANELMKTVCGSIGYDRAGDRRFYNWGVAGKPVNRTLTGAQVAYADPSTEFQTRSSVINRVTVNIDYRYSLLRSISSEVNVYKERNLVTGQFSTQFGPRDIIDYKAFRRDLMIEKAQSFEPWETLSYSIYPLEKAGNGGFVFDNLWPVADTWCQGFKSSIARRVAQPVTESYKFTITAPQSVDAYGKTIDGTELNYALDTEYDEALWEEEFKQTRKRDFDAARAVAQASADNRRADLALAFEAAYRIGKKQIVAAHRQTHIRGSVHSIFPVDLGDVCEHDNRIVDSIGQITGFEYAIGNGIRRTTIRMTISYMDTLVAAPAENWAAPLAPGYPEADLVLESTAEYNADTEVRAFEINVAEIPADYTDELEPAIAESAYTLPLEINSITLVNGR